jgi:hypothetical protein
VIADSSQGGLRAVSRSARVKAEMNRCETILRLRCLPWSGVMGGRCISRRHRQPPSGQRLPRTVCEPGAGIGTFCLNEPQHKPATQLVTVTEEQAEIFRESQLVAEDARLRALISAAESMEQLPLELAYIRTLKGDELKCVKQLHYPLSEHSRL